jgi:hypothetical protein
MKGFPKIFALGSEYIPNILEGDVEITEKVDGCLNYGSLVCLDNGKKLEIGKIVNNKMKLNVLSYNEKTQRVESQPIINWYKNGTTKDWKTIKIKGSHGQAIHIHCTSNHKIMTSGGWVEAQNIKENMLIPVYEWSINEIQKQMLLGTLLGDSSMSGGVFACGHSIKQKQLLELKSKILGSMIVKKENRISGYGSKMIRIVSSKTPITHYLTNICIIDNKKTINNNWLKELTPLSLAFLYMDDGSCSFSDKQKPRLRISLNNFCFDECLLFKNWLLNTYNIDSDICDYKGCTIVLNKINTEKFFSIIFPYIPNDLQYKLPIEYRTGKSIWDYYNFENIKQKLTNRPVIMVSDFTPVNYTKYDIEVANNHNFLVNGVIVHNSFFAFGCDSAGHVVMRSKGKELFFDSYEKIFDKAVEFVIDKQEFLSSLPGMYFYGEYLRTPKHNCLCYDRVPRNNIILFGMYEEGLGFKDINIVAAWAEKLDLETVPVLYSGPVNEMYDKEVCDFDLNTVIKNFLKYQSLLGKQLVEGIVIKNYGQTVMIGNQVYPVFAKLVRPEFKEKLDKTWRSGKDKVQEFVDSFRTEARWEKAIQHLRDEGKLIGDPKDIGALINEIKRDIIEEEELNIKHGLYQLFKDNILRKATAGLPEYYKDKLNKSLS